MKKSAWSTHNTPGYLKISLSIFQYSKFPIQQTQPTHLSKKQSNHDFS